MAYWFDKDYYLDMKLLQLDATGQRMGIQDDDNLERVLLNLGMSAETHYLAYGHAEGLNPNAYFNETEYLHAKLAQLQEDPASGWAGKTIGELKATIAGIGLTPVQHYETYGAFETRADGTVLNPSNGLDANAYVQAKLLQLQRADPSTNLTTQQVLDLFKAAGLSPMSHALLYGDDEQDAFNLPMIQTVPDAQRVEADPARAAVNAVVPGNNAPPSLAPSAVVAPQIAPNPFDMDELPVPDPLPLVPAPPTPTPPTPTPPTPTPPTTPTVPTVPQYTDLIGIERDWNALEFDVNDDSPAYWSLFGQFVQNGVPVPGRVFEHSKVHIEVRANQGSLVTDSSGVRATQLDVTYRLESGDAKLMDDRIVTVPVGTVIDIDSLSDDDWSWAGYDVAYFSSNTAYAGNLVVAGDDVTFVMPHSADGSAVIFDKYNRWSTAGTVEVRRDTDWSAKTLDETAHDLAVLGVPQDTDTLA